MISVFDYLEERPKTIDQYIASIDLPTKRHMVTEMFGHALEVLNHIRDFSPLPKPEIPIIRVNNSDCYAKAMDGWIEVSSDFVNHCLALPPVPYSELVECASDDLPLPHQNPNTFFVWTMAHEYWHGIRKHNIALGMLANDAATLKALEVDADLCAAASMYRYAQSYMYGRYSDVTIRQIVFVSLFWPMRSLPDGDGSESHPSPFDRIRHIRTKLIHIHADPGFMPDPDRVSEENRRNTEPVVMCLLRSEKLYRKLYLDDKRDLFAFLKKDMDENGWTEFTDRWEEVRGLVGITSGTVA